MAGLEDLLAELMEPLGGVSFRRMFGGRGVFKDGLMFALLSSRGIFYFKADEKTVPDFDREGCEQFAPQMKGRKATMPYWRAPERLFDEPEEFAEWARAAFDAAVRTKTAKAPSRKAKTAAVATVSSKTNKRRTGS
jgi:DNA transformation protein and related proteins